MKINFTLVVDLSKCSKFCLSLTFFPQAIDTQENRMISILENMQKTLPIFHKEATFNKDDLLAVLQGIVGFVNAKVSKNPMDFIDSALEFASSLSGKQCLNSLQSILGSIKKWLTFGEKYTHLKESSELDFDQVDVNSVPEVMKVSPSLCFSRVFILQNFI